MPDVTKNIKLKYIVDDAEATQALEEMSMGMKQVDSSSEELQTTITDLNETLEDNTEAMTETAAATEDAAVSAEDAGGAFGAMSGPLKSAKAGLQGVSLAMKAMLANPIVAVIAALVAGFALLFKSLQRSEEGQKKLAIAGAALSAGIDVILDLVTTLAENLFDVFSDPQQAVKDLWEVIKTNLVNRIVGMVELLPELGKAIKQAFSLDFAGAAKTAADALGKATLGIENITDKTIALGESAVDAFTEITNEIITEANAAANLAGRLFDLQKAQAELGVTQAQYMRQIEEQRTISADVTKSEEERIAAAQEAIRLQTELSAKELAVAKEALSIKREQNALGASTQEDVIEEINLRAALEQKRTENVSKQKADIAQLGALQLSLDAQREAARLARETQKDTEHQADIKRADDLAKREIDNSKKVADAKAKDDASIIGSLNAVAGVIASNAEEGSAAAKGAAVFSATLNGFVAITQALAQLGPIAGAIAAVGIGIVTAATIGNILKTPPPKFEHGGTLRVGGERHSSGGTTFMGSDGSAFEAEKGETISILSRGDSQLSANSRLRTSASVGISNDENQTNQVLQQGGNQRVYVTETDLTDVNNRVRSIETAAAI